MQSMRYLALATDYDGTIARDGTVDQPTIEALERCRQSGRKLILVTGRELPDLESVFPRLDLFDRVVAENGALLYHPASHEKRVLAERPPERFVQELKARGVPDLRFGDVIVATWRPHETTVLETIRDLGLELQVIFNKDAVMVLPAGVNKMFGLRAALREVKLSRHNVVGVGDAENDHAFLSCCECSAAVANAIPSLKERADLVTEGDRGAGVGELIGRLREDDLRSIELVPQKHGIPFGKIDGQEIYIPAQGQTVLLCGQSGGGKSTFVAGILEQLAPRGYQTCLVDPEGDYENMPDFLSLGNQDHAPSYEEALQALDDPDSNLTVNLIGVKMEDRPGYFAGLLTELQQKHACEGRPHWLILDEAHHLWGAEWTPAPTDLAAEMPSLLLVTVHPEHVSPAILRQVNVLAVIGKEPRKIAEEFARAAGMAAPEIPADDIEAGHAAVWFRDSNRVLASMEAIPGKAERKRHRRKYAEGELEPENVFYFRGPQGKLNLRAQNLNIFRQLAEGVDDETWLFHLRKGDYSGWMGAKLRDDELAAAVGAIERNRSLSPAESRQKVADAIEERYAAR